MRCWKNCAKGRPQADQGRQELKRLLKEELLAILTAPIRIRVCKVDGRPEVILVVGVNGTGKTTTIGKLANVLRAQGKTVLTVRGRHISRRRHRATGNLGTSARRTEVIKTKPGGDPSAVLYDALQAARPARPTT